MNALEYFNDWGGGVTTIPSPGRSPKQSFAGIGLHDPLHGRQAYPKFSSFHQEVGQISPRKGLFPCRPLPKRGQICDIPAPPPIVERLTGGNICGNNRRGVALLSCHRFPEPPTWYVATSRPSSDPSYQHLGCRDQESKPSVYGDFTAC